MSVNLYGYLADLTAIIHVAYILFVVGGQCLIMAGWLRGWSWTQKHLFRLIHLAAIALVVVEVWSGINCPLTLLENYLRVRAGESMYPSGFIGYWVSWLIYYDAPGWVFTLAYTVFFIIVAVTIIVYPPRRIKNSGQGENGGSGSD